MATSAQTLITRTRRYLRDYPDQDALTASVTSAATTLSVADSSIYFVNEYVEVDQEVVLVKALASGTSLTVSRAKKGSAAASHTTSSTVLVKPAFYAVEILDALNEGIQACFPRIYKEVADTSLTSSDSTYEYTIPTLGTAAIRYISAVELKEPGDLAYRPVRRWTLKRGSTPKLQFRSVPTPSSTIRIRGYSSFPTLTAITDTLDTQWPAEAEWLPSLYAGAVLLQSGEAGRVRMDSGAIDAREQANRTGSSMAAGSALLQRFYAQLERVAMAPMAKNIKAVI